MRNVTGHVVQFFLLMMIQILLLNNLQLGTLCNPYIYIFFLMCLPITTPRWADVVLAFLLGLTIDIFCNTLGVHAFATTFIGYMRYWLIQWMVPDLDRITSDPDYKSFGTIPYVQYVIILTVLHHTLLFFCEVLTFQNFLWLLARIICSSIVTIVLLLGYQSIRQHRKND